MSLVGTLEDLALCDLLQILSLAGKSGLLRLETSEGEGWILFAAGQVAGAGTKAGPPDLGALLRAHDLDAAAAAADPVRVEALRRDAAEAAVVQMLGWRDGAFRLEASEDEAHALATGLRLSTPIPSQYLALEGVRMFDEGSPAAEGAVALATTAPPAAGTPLRLPHPLVVIDPAPGALEWLKRCLGGSFARVHVFQSTELGVTRLRQYLARGEQPVVLLARDARPDPLSGVRDAAALVSRLSQQAPRMPIVLLVERDDAAGALRTRPARGLAAVVARPSVDRLGDPRARAQVEAAGDALRDALLEAVRGSWSR